MKTITNPMIQSHEEDDIEDPDYALQPNQPDPRKQFFTCTSSSSNSPRALGNDQQEDLSCNQTSSSFESMSSSEEEESNALLDDQGDEVMLKKIYSLNSSQQNLSFLFNYEDKQIDSQSIFQANSEALHRQEFGGVVVYDSYARIIGNNILQSYYEQTPPSKIDFSILFNNQQELNICDNLFHKEPRERDFANEFDKFVYKHLPKFQQERNFQNQQTYTINVPQQENILIFDSRFENGNLRRAIKVNNVEYNLLLENDLNTKGHTQWFYFKVIHKYPKSNIFSLISYRAKDLVQSPQFIQTTVTFEETGKGWFRGGDDVKYFMNQIPRKNPNFNHHLGNSNNHFLYLNNGCGEGLEYYFTLSFIYEFDEMEDEIWFAHAVPYTFTDLQNNIKTLMEKEENKEMMKTHIMCKTLANNPCPMLTITNNISTYMDYYDQVTMNKHLPSVVKKQFLKKYQKCKKLYKQSLESKGKVRKLLKAAFLEEIKNFFQTYNEDFVKIGLDNYPLKFKNYIENHFHKKAVFLTARVHPGEPQSSYMLQGTIEYLLSEEASDLRDNFVFRIVPMLNIDGVIYGNYRCSLLGVDLNRKWVQPNVFLHPTIFHAKQLIRQMHSERRVLMFCDYHGHSRKLNAFFYACTYKNFEHEGRIKNAQLRIVPLLCCHKNRLFKFKDCRFRIEKCKESTARVVIFRDFNIMNSFTLECSFFGSEDNIEDETPSTSGGQPVTPLETNKTKQFGIKEFMSVGEELAKVCKILEIFYDEFIKFIPPYILKREEEKMKQMGIDSQNFETPAYVGAKATNLKKESPRQSTIGPIPFNPRSSSVKKQRKSLVGSVLPSSNMNSNNPQTIVHPHIEQSQTPVLQSGSAPIRKLNKGEGQHLIKKGKKKRTLAKKDIQMNEDKNQNIITDSNILEKQMSNQYDVDTFSQMINIPNHQEELIDLEFFLKNVKDSKKTQKPEDEDDLGGDTDSSDSEQSVQELFVKSKNNTSKNKKKTFKKLGSNEQNKVFKSLEGNQSKKNKQTVNKQQINQQMLSIDGKRESQGNYQPVLSSDSTIEPTNQNLRVKKKDIASSLKKLAFDKISHLKQLSPNIQEEDFKAQRRVNDTNLSRNNGNTLLSFDEDKNDKDDERNGNGQFFKSYEDLASSAVIERQKIIPLYENPLYHQNRLTTNPHLASFIVSSEVQSVNNSLIQQHQVPPQTQTSFKVPNIKSYEPYEDYKSSSIPSTSHYGRSITSHMQDSNRNSFKSQKPQQTGGLLNQPTFAPLLSNEINSQYQNESQALIKSQQPFPTSNQSKILSYQRASAKPLEDMYSNRRQQSQASAQNQHSSLQRMSFRELLESSRQTRVTISSNDKLFNKNRHQSKGMSQSSNSGSQNYLLQMLKCTYQRFQQHQAQTNNKQSCSERQEELKDQEYLSQSPNRKISVPQEDVASYLNVKSYMFQQESQPSNSIMTSIQPESGTTLKDKLAEITTGSFGLISKNEKQLISSSQKGKLQSQYQLKNLANPVSHSYVANNTSILAVVPTTSYQVQPETPLLQNPQLRIPTPTLGTKINRNAHQEKRRYGQQINTQNHTNSALNSNQSNKKKFEDEMNTCITPLKKGNKKHCGVLQQAFKISHQKHTHTTAPAMYDTQNQIELSIVSQDRMLPTTNQKQHYIGKNNKLPPSTSYKKATKSNLN